MEENGVTAIHVPKTMDLDLHTYSVGGDSTINRIARYVNDLKTTGKNHNRIMVVPKYLEDYAGHSGIQGGMLLMQIVFFIPESLKFSISL